MKTSTQIIEDLGGNTAVAHVLGIPATTVSSWKARESIPAEYWMAIVEHAKRLGVKGISVDGMAKLAAANRSGAAA